MRVTDEMVSAALRCQPFPEDRYVNGNMFNMFWRLPSEKRSAAMRAALEAALSHAAGQEVVHTWLNHEAEPHCCGCYVIDGQSLMATCNECGHKVDLADPITSALGASQPAVARSEGEEQRQPIAFGNVTAWTSPGHGGGMTHYGIELGNDYEQPCIAATLVGKRFALIPVEQKP